MTERFFILTPTATDQTETVTYQDDSSRDFAVYLDASGLPMKWSGDFPVPAIGSRVFITMNRIGWAFVVGFFESGGYVGLMTKPTNPPKWLRDQQRRARKEDGLPQWQRQGIGCTFGAECKLKRPTKNAAPSQRKNDESGL
jgi:hypothetical protein